MIRIVWQVTFMQVNLFHTITNPPLLNIQHHWQRNHEHIFTASLFIDILELNSIIEHTPAIHSKSIDKKHTTHYSDVIMSAKRRLDRLLNGLFRPRTRLRVTGLCEGKSLLTGEFPAQRASNAENVSIWWRNHESMLDIYCKVFTINALPVL